ncbi:hypothetical protein IV203_014422 [Nitzschia inconspicua]|uniref:Uncharacterized protein n=1 Tax=Nitzschia inconspicua TaxID=303405 RepID=A0A9K3PS54_9STRA|nr:hypothetical protein IV203_014422 [Nitzschia inconspicua]
MMSTDDNIDSLPLGNEGHQPDHPDDNNSHIIIESHTNNNHGHVGFDEGINNSSEFISAAGSSTLPQDDPPNTLQHFGTDPSSESLHHQHQQQQQQQQQQQTSHHHPIQEHTTTDATDSTTSITTTTPTTTPLTDVSATTIAHIHPNNLIVAPDGAIYAMIKPPDNYQGGPIPHYQNLTLATPLMSNNNNNNNNNNGNPSSVMILPNGIAVPSNTTTTTTGTTLPYTSVSTKINPPRSVDGQQRSALVTATGYDVISAAHGDATSSVNDALINSHDSSKRIKTYHPPIPIPTTTTTLLPPSTLPGGRNNNNNNDDDDDAYHTRVIAGRVYSLYRETDDDRNLSQYQCMARQQMQLFEATMEDTQRNAQGRNRAVRVGQVGIRCKHCFSKQQQQQQQQQQQSQQTTTIATTTKLKTGAVYFPTRLDGVYQTAQKMTVGHLIQHCPNIPDEIRERLIFLKDQKSSDGGGKMYWSDGVRALGVVETKHGLYFATSTTTTAAAATQDFQCIIHHL